MVSTGGCFWSDASLESTLSIAHDVTHDSDGMWEIGLS